MVPATPEPQAVSLPCSKLDTLHPKETTMTELSPFLIVFDHQQAALHQDTVGARQRGPQVGWKRPTGEVIEEMTECAAPQELSDS